MIAALALSNCGAKFAPSAQKPDEKQPEKAQSSSEKQEGNTTASPPSVVTGASLVCNNDAESSVAPGETAVGCNLHASNHFNSQKINTAGYIFKDGYVKSANGNVLTAAKQNPGTASYATTFNVAAADVATSTIYTKIYDNKNQLVAEKSFSMADAYQAALAPTHVVRFSIWQSQASVLPQAIGSPLRTALSNMFVNSESGVVLASFFDSAGGIRPYVDAKQASSNDFVRFLFGFGSQATNLDRLPITPFTQAVEGFVAFNSANQNRFIVKTQMPVNNLALFSAKTVKAKSNPTDLVTRCPHVANPGKAYIAYDPKYQAAAAVMVARINGVVQRNSGGELWDLYLWKYPNLNATIVCALADKLRVNAFSN
jgi:hypothetical protein